MIKDINLNNKNNDKNCFDAKSLFKFEEDLENQYLDNLGDNIIADSTKSYLINELARECFELGMTYFSVGKYILSARYLKKAVPFNPRLVNYFLGQSYHNKAKIIERSGNFEASSKSYDKAISYYFQAMEESGILPDNRILNNLINTISLEIGEKTRKVVQ